MNPYALVRNWVDACLAGPSAMSRADIPVVLPIGVLGILIFSVSRDAAAIVIFGIAASAWTAFIIWRGWRLGRADSLKRDRRERRRR